MRRTALACLLVCVAAGAAFAHGGGSYRGPGPPPPGASEPWSGRFAPPPEPGGRGPVTGRVLAADGAPVDGACVWCDGETASATLPDGRFRCAPVRYPSTLVVSAVGHAPARVTVRAAPAPGAHLDLGTLRLESGGELTGRVEAADGDGERIWIRVVPEGGRVPEEFARVGELIGWGGVTVRPGERFVFRGLPPGDYRLRARRPDGDEVDVARALRPGCDAVTVRVEHVPEVPPAVPPPACDGTLRVTGIAGRRIAVIERARGTRVATHAGGDAVELAVPSGVDLDLLVADSEGLDLPIEGLTAGRDVALRPPSQRSLVAGTVVRPDGSAVPRARVRVHAVADTARVIGCETETDAEGRFVVHGVAGLLVLRARAPGLSNDALPCVVRAGDDAVRVVVEEERIP